AGGVATVTLGARSGDRQRASHAPEADPHIGLAPTVTMSRAGGITTGGLYHRRGAISPFGGGETRRVRSPGGLERLDQGEVLLARVGHVEDVELLLGQAHAAVAVGAVAAG